MNRLATTAAMTCALALAGCGGKPESEKVTDEAGRFRAVFPPGFPPPIRKVRTWQHDGRPRQLILWSSSGGEGTAAAGWFDVPEGVEVDLDRACRDAVESVQGTVTAGPDEVTVAGMKPARRIAFTSGSTATPLVGTARLVRDDKRVYQLIYFAPAGTDLNRSPAADFFNSLTIGELKPAKRS